MFTLLHCNMNKLYLKNISGIANNSHNLVWIYKQLLCIEVKSYFFYHRTYCFYAKSILSLKNENKKQTTDPHEEQKEGEDGSLSSDVDSSSKMGSGNQCMRITAGNFYLQYSIIKIVYSHVRDV